MTDEIGATLVEAEVDAIALGGPLVAGRAVALDADICGIGAANGFDEVDDEHAAKASEQAKNGARIDATLVSFLRCSSAISS